MMNVLYKSSGFGISEYYSGTYTCCDTYAEIFIIPLFFYIKNIPNYQYRNQQVKKYSYL